MIIPEWIPSEPWAGYVEMRKKLKKPMTDRAIELRVKDLEAFRDQGFDLAQILDQSTANNWTDLYEPRDKTSRNAADAGRKIPQLGKVGNATATAAEQWLDEGPMDDTLPMRRRFAVLITNLSDYYNKEISKAKLGIYWAGLRQFSYEAIEKACWAHTQLPDEAGRWMPLNADIIRMIEGSTVDQAAISWSKVETAVRVRGPWDDLVFDDALIHRVIADMGGWIQMCSKEEKEWPFVGKEFQTRYRAFKMRGEIPEYPGRLTGLANASNASTGMPLMPPILIGNVKDAKKVLKAPTLINSSPSLLTN